MTRSKRLRFSLTTLMSQAHFQRGFLIMLQTLMLILNLISLKTLTTAKYLVFQQKACFSMRLILDKMMLIKRIRREHLLWTLL